MQIFLRIEISVKIGIDANLGRKLVVSENNLPPFIFGVTFL